MCDNKDVITLYYAPHLPIYQPPLSCEYIILPIERHIAESTSMYTVVVSSSGNGQLPTTSMMYFLLQPTITSGGTCAVVSVVSDVRSPSVFRSPTDTHGRTHKAVAMMSTLHSKHKGNVLLLPVDARMFSVSRRTSPNAIDFHTSVQFENTINPKFPRASGRCVVPSFPDKHIGK